MNFNIKSIQSISRVQFFLGWVIITTLIFYVAELTAFYISRLSQFLSIEGFSPIPILIIALFIALISYLQQWLIQRFLNVQIRWWWLLTAIAYTVSITLQETMWANFYTNPSWTDSDYFLAFILSSVIRYSLIGLVQGWLLRPFLKHIWIYSGVFVFIGMIYTYVHLVEYFAIVTGILSSVILLWLHHITHKPHKD